MVILGHHLKLNKKIDGEIGNSQFTSLFINSPGNVGIRTITNNAKLTSYDTAQLKARIILSGQ